MTLLKKTPVTEIRLFKVGPNETSKGTVIFDGSCVETILSNYQKEFSDSGKRVPFNYNHSVWSDNSNPESGIVAGWCDLECRDDGVYAINISWTVRATQYIEQEEYKYYSPEITSDGDMRLTSVFGVAVTNIPSMYDVQSIALSKQNQDQIEERQRMEEIMNKLMEVLKVAKPEEILPAIEALMAADKLNESADPAGDVPDAELEDGIEVEVEMEKELNQLKNDVIELSKQVKTARSEALHAALASVGAPVANAKRMEQLSKLVSDELKDGKSILESVQLFAKENGDLFTPIVATKQMDKVSLTALGRPVSDKNDKSMALSSFNARRTVKVK